jgi:hypothetical protein
MLGAIKMHSLLILLTFSLLPTQAWSIDTVAFMRSYDKMMGFDACGDSSQSVTCLLSEGWQFDTVSISVAEKYMFEVELSDTIKLRKLLKKNKYLKNSIAEWRLFISKMEPLDILMYFSSPENSWNQLAGMSGYAIVSAGRIVLIHTTIVN